VFELLQSHRQSRVCEQLSMRAEFGQSQLPAGERKAHKHTLAHAMLRLASPAPLFPSLPCRCASLSPGFMARQISPKSEGPQSRTEQRLRRPARGTARGKRGTRRGCSSA
jgi:hypothetical protein